MLRIQEVIVSPSQTEFALSQGPPAKFVMYVQAYGYNL